MPGPAGARVLVTGAAALTPVVGSPEHLPAALRAGLSAIGERGAALPGAAREVGAFLDGFDFEARLVAATQGRLDLRDRARAAARRAPLSARVSMVCALQAWADAHLPELPVDPLRIGLVVAAQNINQGYAYEAGFTFRQEPTHLSPAYAMHHFDSDHLGILGEVLGIRGEGFTTGAASASGNMALLQARRLVQFGVVDACVVVGALNELSPVEWQAFRQLGAMSTNAERPASAMCRPFDGGHDGFVYGQGSACLILESEISAARRGVRAHAELAGGAATLDGNRSANPSAEGEARAMRLALADAGLEAADIDYLNAHGSSSPLGDDTEVAAIKDVFKDCLAAVRINSTKGLWGHCLSAAGVLEAVATVVQIAHGFVHPNANLEAPIDDDCRFVGGQAEPATLRAALSNSMGFGGINSALIFRRA